MSLSGEAYPESQLTLAVLGASNERWVGVKSKRDPPGHPLTFLKSQGGPGPPQASVVGEQQYLPPRYPPWIGSVE